MIINAFRIFTMDAQIAMILTVLHSQAGLHTSDTSHAANVDSIQ